MDPLHEAIERQRAKNKPLTLPEPMSILRTLIATQKGWIIRQVLKGAGYAGAAVTTWLVSHKVGIDNPEAVTAAISTVAVGLLEMALSKLASPIATPK